MNSPECISNLHIIINKFGYLSEYYSWPLLYLILQSIESTKFVDLPSLCWEQILFSANGNISLYGKENCANDSFAEEVSGHDDAPAKDDNEERNLVDAIGRLILKAIFNEVGDLEKVSCPFILTEPEAGKSGNKCIFVPQNDTKTRLVSQDLLDLLNDMIIDTKIEDREDDEGIESDTLSAGLLKDRSRGETGTACNGSLSSCSSGGSSNNLAGLNLAHPLLLPPRFNSLPQQYPGLSIQRVLERCSDHLKSYNFRGNDIVNECKAICKSLALGQSTMDIQDLLGTMHSLSATLSPEYTNENLNESNWDDIMEEIKTGGVVLKAVTPIGASRYSLSVPSGLDRNHLSVNGLHQSYGDIANEIKINFPTLRKTPCKSTPNPNSKVTPVTIHEKLMREIQDGLRLNHVKTLDKSITMCAPANKTASNASQTSLSVEVKRQSSSPVFNLGPQTTLTNPWIHTQLTPKKSIGFSEQNNPILSPFVPFYYCDFTQQQMDSFDFCNHDPLPVPDSFLQPLSMVDERDSSIYNEKSTYVNSFKRNNTVGKGGGRSPFMHTKSYMESQELNVEKNPNLLNLNGRRSPNLKTKTRRFNQRRSDEQCVTSNNDKKWLSLSFKEFCHIRRALFSAELETYYVNNMSLYKSFTCKKVCSACHKTRWSIFGQQGVKCHICTRILCLSCHEKIQLTEDHLLNIPTTSLIPLQLSVEKCENFFKIPYDNSSRTSYNGNTNRVVANSQIQSNHLNDTSKSLAKNECATNNSSKTSFTNSLSSHNSDISSQTSSTHDVTLILNEEKSAKKIGKNVENESPNLSQRSSTRSTTSSLLLPDHEIIVCHDCVAILKRSWVLTKLKRADTKKHRGPGALFRNSSHCTTHMNTSIISRS